MVRGTNRFRKVGEKVSQMNQLTTYEVSKLLHSKHEEWRSASYDDVNRVKMEINHIVERSYQEGLDEEVRSYIRLKRTLSRQNLQVAEDQGAYYYRFPLIKEGELQDTGFMIITKK